MDHIRRQDKSISYEAFGAQGLKRSIGVNIDSKTLVVWSFSLETYKPQLMDVQDIDQASAII